MHYPDIQIYLLNFMAAKIWIFWSENPDFSDVRKQWKNCAG